ncbi:MAG TPA: hypothetical protein VMU59_04415 [Caulobacteraceae bacterium]|nr:hypothetical protein [Caulobacteraceae bacterium]
MRRFGLMATLAAAAALGLIGSAPARAQPMDERGPPKIAQIPGVKSTFVRLGQGEPGVLYEPTNPGTKAQIALFVMHSAGDYLSHSACTELSKRGYRVLCANNSNSKSGAFDDGRLDGVLLEAKRGIQFLRAYPGVKKIVLFGHSGGATVMTAYQDIAENGVKVCQDAIKVHKCPDSLAGLPPADGVVLGDGNYGVAEMTLFSVDPAVTDEASGVKLDESIDLFNPANGFKPGGSSFSPAFVHRFLAAEGARNNRLIKLAQDRLAAIEAGKGEFLDDEPFIVPGASLLGGNNRLFAQDVRLLSHTQKPWPLVHPDGSITNEIVHTVRVPENPQNTSPFMIRGAMKTTVRGFLSTYAIRTDKDFGYDEDSIHGVEWTSSYSSPPGNAEGISAPILTLGMTGHWEFLAAELVYDHAKSADKSIAFIEGATHGYTPCAKCEKTPGQFGDTVKTLYDYVDGWLSKPGRFM